MPTMNLEQILSHLSDFNDDDDFRFLLERLASGDLSVRKQVADFVTSLPSGRLPVKVVYEVSKWGVNDDLSMVKEIRESA
jgi:hypothetical protein